MTRMITRVDHLVVLVSDLERATCTYSRLLGLEPSWRGRHPGLGTENTLFRFSNTYLELISPSGAGELADALGAALASRGEGPLALAFGTEDARAAAAELRARGLPAPEPTEGSGVDDASGAERRWLSFVLPVERTRGVFLMVVEHLGAPDSLPAARPTAVPESAVSTVDHVVILTGSADAAIALYGDALGLRLALDRSFEQRGMRLVFFRVGGLTVECAAATAKNQSLGPRLTAADSDRFWGISYKVADVEAARVRAVAAGFDVSEARAGFKPGTRVCTVRGPTHGVATLLIGPDPAV